MALCLICGTRDMTWVDEAAAVQDCPMCRARRAVYPAKTYTACHLYFVPLLPLRSRSFFKCRACAARFFAAPADEAHRHLERLRLVPATAAFSGASWYSRFCTYELSCACQKASAAGEDELHSGGGGPAVEPAAKQPQHWLYLAAPPVRGPPPEWPLVPA